MLGVSRDVARMRCADSSIASAPESDEVGRWALGVRSCPQEDPAI